MTETEPRFRLLGVPAFAADGELVPLPDTMPARVLALLALRGAAVSRSELAGILYPEQPESVARQRLRLQLSRARKLNPAVPLRSSAHYVSCVAATDVHELLRDVEEGNWQRVGSLPAPRLLAGWELHAGLADELRPLQERLGEAWLLAVMRSSQDLVARDQPEAAFGLLARALASEPTAEAALQLLLHVARPAGRTREADAAYRAFREAVAPLEPLPRTTELHHRMHGRRGGAGPDPEQVEGAAAVLGEHVTPGRVAQIINAPLAAVVEALGGLERAGKLTAEGRLRDPQPVLEALTAVEKRFLHAQAARALAQADLPFAAGEQWLLAGDSERAVAAWFPATTRLLGREIGRQEEALAFYERILALPVRSAAWYAASAYYAMLQWQLQGPAPAMARVEEVLMESDDPHARTFALLVRGLLELAAGDVAAAERTMHLSEGQARAVDIPALQRDVLFHRARVLAQQGRTAAALQIADDMVERLSLEPPRLARLTWLGMQAGLLCDLGRFDEALASYREQLLLARTLGFRRDEVRVVADILATLNDMGRSGEEMELGFRALELGTFDVTWPLRLNLAEALAATGREHEAIGQIDAILASDASTVSTRGHALALKLRLCGAGGGLLEQATGLALSTDLVPVRVAIAAALASAEPDAASDVVGRLLEGVSSEEVPAWQEEQWRLLVPYLHSRVIRI